MRCVIQRTNAAAVRIDGEVVGQIDQGLVVLVAFAPTDSDEELRWLARKIPSLRLFNDDEGRINCSLREVGGGILLVSQFTLYGDCRKGNRPSFVASAPPEQAALLYDRFGGLLREQWSKVAEGRFGAMMDVELVNAGPVTLLLEREAKGAAA
ncbi:MAG: D-aminoacyl-tRNA deacylase [bacterium]